MKLEEQNLLFFSRSTQHGGTENVILQLCEIFHPLVNKIVVVSANGFATEKLQPFGIKHYAIADIESKSPITILNVAKAIKRIVAEENITVIHTHHRMAAFYVKLLGLYKNCIFINTSHNTFYNKRLLTRIAYKDANLIACGEMVKKNLSDFFGLHDITVIHNAVKPFFEQLVDEETFQQSRKSERFIVANIGRLSEQKGMEYYIRAIPIIKQKHPEVDFFIIGTGEDEEALKTLATQQGARVTFLGYREDIQNLMAQTDLVVLSSLWEGLPLTPIEAFSVGKTVVATGVDGTCEIVKDGKNGLLIPPKNVDEIANKVCWMIENPEKRKMLEKEAKATFDDYFSFEAFAEKYKKYYEGL